MAESNALSMTSKWISENQDLPQHSSLDQGAVCTSLAMDTEWIVVGAANSKIYVFDSKTGTLSKTLEGHESGVWCTCLISKTESQYLGADEVDGNKIEAWDELLEKPYHHSDYSETWQMKVKALESKTSLESDDNEVESSDQSHKLTGAAKGFGNRSALLVSGACDRTVRIWDLETGECKQVLEGHTSTVRCIKVLDGRPLAISGSRDSSVRVWDLKRGCLAHLLSGHKNSVRTLAVYGTKVVSGSYDCTARIWDVLTGECHHVLSGHFHQVYAVDINDRLVATGSLDSTIRVYDSETGDNLAVLSGHTSLVGLLQISKSRIVSGGSDGRIMIYNAKTFETLHRIPAHDNSVTALQFDEQDNVLVTGGNDGNVRQWDLESGEFVREVCEISEQVWKVSFVRGDKCVVVSKRDAKTMMDLISLKPKKEDDWELV